MLRHDKQKLEMPENRDSVRAENCAPDEASTGSETGTTCRDNSISFELLNVKLSETSL